MPLSGLWIEAFQLVLCTEVVDSGTTHAGASTDGFVSLQNCTQPSAYSKLQADSEEQVFTVLIKSLNLTESEMALLRDLVYCPVPMS